MAGKTTNNLKIKSTNRRERSGSVGKLRQTKEADAKEANEKKEYLKLSREKLNKKCKEYKVTFDPNNKTDTIDKLYKAIKKKSKKEKKNDIKKKCKPKAQQTSLRQSTIMVEVETPVGARIDEKKIISNTSSSSTSSFSDTDSFGAAIFDGNGTGTLSKLNEDDSNNSMQFKHDMINDNKNTKRSKHVKSSSIIQLSAQAPKMLYAINEMRSWNTIKDLKEGLPISVQSGQCKLFYGGKELDDNQTLQQLEINDDTILKCLLSWKCFKPDPTAAHPKTIEHEHMNILQEIRKINEFQYFNSLISNILKEIHGIDIELEEKEQKIMKSLLLKEIYGIDIKLEEKEEKEQSTEQKIMRVLHGYCICLSGDRTYDRKWTALHTICYDYQDDIGDVEEILRKTNLYIDTWPHSGYDTPLRLAIANHGHNEKVIDLVEFLILNGARRMIRRTVFNLKRIINDALYKDMNGNIRKELIKILEPYVDEDPFKGTQ